MSGPRRGIETVLRRALVDRAFRKDLLARRCDAVDDAGIALSPSERAVLQSVTEQGLDEMLARLPVPPPPPFGGPVPEAMACTGIRPDMVPRAPVPEPPAQSEVCRGTRPDAGPDDPHGESPVRGIRPGIPIAIAAGAVLAGGAASTFACCDMCSAGARPDLPPLLQGATSLDGGNGDAEPDGSTPRR